jgi:hypothetical protein
VTDLRRRSFLLGLGAAGVAGAAGGAATTGVAMAAADGSGDHQPRFVPFEGAHQQGITAQPVPALGLMAAFDVVSGDRDGLREMLRELTAEVRGLMAGRPPQQRSPAYPPVDSGILGDRPPADDLSVVVGVGASLFDDRFGLRDRRPRELVEMPSWPTTGSTRPARTATSWSPSRPTTPTRCSSLCARSCAAPAGTWCCAGWSTATPAARPGPVAPPSAT